MEALDWSEQLEEIVGSVARCYALMHLYERCQQAASGNEFSLAKLPTAQARFRKAAKAERFSDSAINYFLRNN